MRKPAPGADATVPGKPRNLDESLHAHAADIAVRSLLCEATLCRPSGGASQQTRFDIACSLTKMRRCLLSPKCGFLSGSVQKTASSPGSCGLGRRARDIPFTSWINCAASCLAAVRAPSGRKPSWRNGRATRKSASPSSRRQRRPDRVPCRSSWCEQRCRASGDKKSPARGELSACRASSKGQRIANAMSISPSVPQAIMTLVVMSNWQSPFKQMT